MRQDQEDLHQEDLHREDLWRDRLHAAEQEYQRARADADAALERCGCDATTADIELHFQARARESAVLDEFIGVLKIFHDMITSRKPPSS